MNKYRWMLDRRGPNLLRRAALLATLAAAAGGAMAGSLYHEATFRPLTADNKAHRVGDVITVQVIENASASTNADTTTRRKNNLALEAAGDGHSVAGHAAVAGDFDGGGTTQRAGRLLAQLSVSVVAMLPEGDMMIAGQQELLVNGEQQLIRVKGRVRPQDISDGNVVLSSRLADASITYAGDGELSERQKRGWWRRLMDGVGF